MSGEATPRRTAARAFQDALQRTYDRRGPRGLLIVGYLTYIAVILPIDVLLMLVLGDYAGLSVGGALPLALAHAGFLLVALALGLLVSRDAIGVWLSWSGKGRSSARAKEVWNKGTRASRVVVVRTCIAVFLLSSGVALPVLFVAWDIPAEAFVPQLLALALILATGGVASLLYIELLLRPGLLDVARFLPAGFVPSNSTLSLKAKAILPIWALSSSPVRSSLASSTPGGATGTSS